MRSGLQSERYSTRTRTYSPDVSQLQDTDEDPGPVHQLQTHEYSRVLAEPHRFVSVALLFALL